MNRTDEARWFRAETRVSGYTETNEGASMNATITVYRVPKGAMGKPQPTLVKVGKPGHGRKVLGGHKPAKRATNTWGAMGSTNKRAAVPMAQIRFERPKRRG